MEWMPIETTAPVDGAWAIVWQPPGKVYCAWVQRGEKTEDPTDYRYFSFEKRFATHWMPLPPPPVHQEEEK